MLLAGRKYGKQLKTKNSKPKKSFDHKIARAFREILYEIRALGRPSEEVTGQGVGLGGKQKKCLKASLYLIVSRRGDQSARKVMDVYFLAAAGVGLKAAAAASSDSELDQPWP